MGAIDRAVEQNQHWFPPLSARQKHSGIQNGGLSKLHLLINLCEGALLIEERRRERPIVETPSSIEMVVEQNCHHATGNKLTITRRRCRLLLLRVLLCCGHKSDRLCISSLVGRCLGLVVRGSESIVQALSNSS